MRYLVIWLLMMPVYAQDKFSLIGANKSPNFNLATAQQVIKEISVGPKPADAIPMAVADITSLQPGDRPFHRYVWIPDGSKDKYSQVSFTLNAAVSQSANIFVPASVANGTLVRVDLRPLAADDIYLSKLIALWDKMAVEPYFHVNAKESDVVSIPSVAGDPSGSVRFLVDGQLHFRSSNGQLFAFSNGAWASKRQQAKGNDVSAFGSHLDLNQAVILQSLTQSNAPIVRYDWFIVKALSSLDGGLYYDFVGVERNPKGKSAQDAWLESLGLSEKFINNLRSDQRAAILRSNVTGRPRRIDVFQGSYVRPSSGSGLVTITHDIGEGDIGADTDPIRNLLELKDKAREVIAERRNGLHIFLLFDNKGNLQNSAPDDVVRDHTIPSPHPARVQSAIGCIRCHGPFDGLQPFNNDVQKLLKSYLNIFDDFASKESIPRTLERLAGLYTGDLQKVIRRGRDDYSDAVFQATLGLTVPAVSEGVANTYGSYFYDLVDAQKACNELGFIVPKEKAVEYFGMLVPPLDIDETGIRPEDPILGALKAGLSVNRFQWELVYADAAFRASMTSLTQEKIVRDNSIRVKGR
jgi:hypothetical protein